MQPQSPTWYELKANIPYLGPQHAAWLSADPYRAALIQGMLAACPGAPLRVFRDGKPVAAGAMNTSPTPNFFPGWPGFPMAAG